MTVFDICKKAKRAANAFSSVTTEEKNLLLKKIAEKVVSATEMLLKTNMLDLEIAKENGRNSAFLDRLTLTEKRISLMAEGINAIIALPDAVGEITEEYTLKNGLDVKKVRAPLGVIGIIYEARPNVTIDAAALCIKSGNAVVLRGGRDAINSNRYLVGLMKEAFCELGFDGDVIGFIDGTDRSLTAEMLACEGLIDVVIPRGGEELKKYVLSNAKMPVIASSGGNCHIYIEKSADFAKAMKIVLNAKLSRPSVCNACETLLIDRDIAREFLPLCLTSLSESGVEIRGTDEVKAIYPDTVDLEDGEFYKEYCDLIIKVAVVEDYKQAIDHINTYNTKHSEAIVSENEEAIAAFSREVDAGAVYINASTRFTDGFELGLGAEMGISTQKLHVRGPIGLRELTSVKYVVTGKGHIRV